MKKLTISLILITSCFYVMAQVKSSLEIFNIETDAENSAFGKPMIILKRPIGARMGNL
jgi:hypothetical protein